MAWVSDYKYTWCEKLAMNVIRSGGHLPDHVAFIMDGNRRYAKLGHIRKQISLSPQQPSTSQAKRRKIVTFVDLPTSGGINNSILSELDLQPGCSTQVETEMSKTIFIIYANNAINC
uniref:Uncharacterized protein n=1 Tax=Glossina palpalis gambiensis TaxID=67801 RepID=A0A1B0BND3_9MUSC